MSCKGSEGSSSASAVREKYSSLGYQAMENNRPKKEGEGGPKEKKDLHQNTVPRPS